MPPKTEEVPQLVQEFIEWLNLDKSWGLNPILLAGIVHYEIARIHPNLRKNGQAQIALTPRQMKIVEFINVNGKVTNKDLQSLFNISAQAVHKELVKLVELKVIKPAGEGRALHYILV